MKNFQFILFCAFSVVIFESCQENHSNLDVDHNTNFDINQLVGNWKDEGTNKQFYEDWKPSPDGLEGLGFVLSQGDTIMIENMRITQEKESLVYEVKVNKQNYGQPIQFKATDFDSLHVVFENLDHDFPQTITYTLISKDELRVKLLGEEHENPRELDFQFSRIN